MSEMKVRHKIFALVLGLTLLHSNEVAAQPAVLFASFADSPSPLLGPDSVIILFSEPMKPSISIRWSANVDPSKITYEWSEIPVFLTCKSDYFPANATVELTLNPVAGAPENFRSMSGSELKTGTKLTVSTGS
ncbi:MAG TPA: hypothetical protein PLX89_21885, partial [Verrucomicrobiota bacterium]|nr:hypothetical protein [Verrucomicrobiales bacterium]HRI15656.1 hypothetical protein [Verrucomicrobiota bacterium]